MVNHKHLAMDHFLTLVTDDLLQDMHHLLQVHKHLLTQIIIPLFLLNHLAFLFIPMDKFKLLITDEMLPSLR